MICFVQFRDNTGCVQTKFLFISDLLKNSLYSDAETIFDSVLARFEILGLDPEKFSSIFTDGAAAMVGEKNELGGKIRFPKILAFHYVCHWLALAKTDFLTDEKYIV